MDGDGVETGNSPVTRDAFRLPTNRELWPRQLSLAKPRQNRPTETRWTARSTLANVGQGVDLLASISARRVGTEAKDCGQFLNTSGHSDGYFCVRVWA